MSLDTSRPSSGSPALYTRCTPLGVAVLAPAGFGLPSRTRPGPSMSPRNFLSGCCVILWRWRTSRSGAQGSEKVSGWNQAHCRLSRFSSLSSSRSTLRAELNSSLDVRPAEANFAALPATTIAQRSTGVYRLGARPGAATPAQERPRSCARQPRSPRESFVCTREQFSQTLGAAVKQLRPARRGDSLAALR